MTDAVLKEGFGGGAPVATEGFGNGAKHVWENSWGRLDRIGKATVTAAALIAVLGVMLATAGQAHAGTCAGTTDIASLEVQSLLPPAPVA